MRARGSAVPATTLRNPAVDKITSTSDAGFAPERKTTRVRQTLSKGLIVAVAATTSALSLYGTWAFATPGMLGTAAQSPAVLSGHAARWDTEDGLDGLDGLEDKLSNLDDRLDNLRVPEPWFEDDTFGYDTGDSSGSHSEQPSGHSGKVPSGYGPEEPSGYGSEEMPGYGHEEPSGYGREEPPGYGHEEPSDKPTCECHHPTPRPTPTKTATPPPPHKPTPPPPSHKPTPTPSKTPPTKPHHPQLPETGSEGIIAATAAGGALLAAGTVLYRRGRAGSHR